MERWEGKRGRGREWEGEREGRWRREEGDRVGGWGEKNGEMEGEIDRGTKRVQVDQYVEFSTSVPTNEVSVT